MPVRKALPQDADAISALHSLAFGSTAEAEIIRKLSRDKADIIAFVYSKKDRIIGHIQLYEIRLGEINVAGLGPMGVHPDHQRKGIGRLLIKAAIRFLKEKTKYPLFFVLGHPEFYPRFGFSSAMARHFTAPWSGPSFMGMTLIDNAPQSGDLLFPKAFL